MSSIMDRVRSLFGRGGDDGAADGPTEREARTKEEDIAIERVEQDMVRSRDQAFYKLQDTPGSVDDHRY